MKKLILFLSLIALFSCSSDDGDIFGNLTFEQGIQLAGEQRKMLFLDFYSPT